jgi:hypothetical protein
MCTNEQQNVIFNAYSIKVIYTAKYCKNEKQKLISIHEMIFYFGGTYSGDVNGEKDFQSKSITSTVQMCSTRQE